MKSTRSVSEGKQKPWWVTTNPPKRTLVHLASLALVHTVLVYKMMIMKQQQNIHRTNICISKH